MGDVAERDYLAYKRLFEIVMRIAAAQFADLSQHL